MDRFAPSTATRTGFHGLPFHRNTTTYASLVDINNRDVRNPQKLSSVWGEIKTEFEEHEAEVRDSNAILGKHGFLVGFDAPDRESAFKSALTLCRHGISAQTMEITATDDFAHLVDEV